ncbi:putative phage coiled coil domain-containing protein [Burkholderia aenigmatica]|uniref:Putative phage coiled coil domain-containing protein n=1 Tax=Burkholderia aenigmatica TaxID=2015348 RepID=A0A6P2N8G1_9BURK|nr:hypothetical protein [Burkholderia aenigmatica]VWB88963.1 putative phage coiled coil domain-containing protein [Burkholderia aenigmatica]
MTTTTELTVVERAAVALTSTERETSLRELVAKSTDMVEIKNAAARDQVHSAAMVLRTARTDIKKAAKAARDDANAFSTAVIAEENRLIAITEPEEKRLIRLRDVWDEAREAEKRAKLEAEQRRVAAIREHIDDIRAIAVRVAGRTAAQIQIEITDLVAIEIDVPRFAELTGEAEMARGTTLDKLRELHAAAVAQEAEAARLAAEREELDRQRAELEAQRQRDEAERTERERVEAAARAEHERAEAAERAEQERVERERRDAEEAARRAQQEREDAERRAAIAAEDARLANERAEMARRQAELDRAEREQREREEAALREAAELAAQAERDRVARERADNRAAMLAPGHTGGTWSIGKTGGCVVTTAEIAGCPGSGHNDAEYYGGNLICESVYRPADAHLIAAAPALLAALQAMVHKATKQNWNDAYPEQLAQAFAAIEKATYVPAEETAAA